jgi:hypothetical protein
MSSSVTECAYTYTRTHLFYFSLSCVLSRVYTTGDDDDVVSNRVCVHSMSAYINLI